MKFIATTSDKLQNITIASGQLIFSRDNRVIYLDVEGERISFQQIITLNNEEARQNLTSPVQGFYFIKDTKILWNYENSIWTQITESPKENLIFANYKDFPIQGEQNVLYVDNKKIYQWDEKIQDYIEMGALIWETIS